MQNDYLFCEKQRFNQWWIWLIFLAANGITFYGIYHQVIKGNPIGTKPMDDVAFLIVAGLLFLFTLFFFSLRLDTEIRTDGIYVRFFPLHRKFRFYSWSQLSKLYIRQYAPLREYGGWGFRGWDKNKALNVSGNNGLQIEFSDGKKLLIGTKKPDELSEVLTRIGQLKP